MFTFLKTRKDHPGRFHHHCAPQIFDLLKLSKREHECRKEFLNTKKKLQKWHASYEDEKNYFLKSILQHEGIVLRHEAAKAVLFYRLVRRERMRMFHDYIERLPIKRHGFRTAS